MSTSVADKLAKKSRKKLPAKQVRLRLVYIDFWSAVKLSFLVAVCIAVVIVVATFLIYTILIQTGVLGSLNSLFSDVAGSGQFDLFSMIGLPQVMSVAVIVAILNIVVGTALGAVAAVIYNLTVKITGGILIGFTNA